MNRREWLVRTIQSLAAAGLLPFAYAGEEQHEHHAAAQAVPGAPWKPEFFTIEQNDTLVAVGERIVPGSAAALCNRFIDLLMTVESDPNRRQLLDALAAFDREARSRYSGNYRELPRDQQDAILLSGSTGKEGLHSHFATVKGWMTDVYWSSKTGLQELGWSGRMAWESYPACEHAGSHD